MFGPIVDTRRNCQILVLAAGIAVLGAAAPAAAKQWTGERIEPEWCLSEDSREAVRVSKRVDREQKFRIGDFSDAACRNPRYRVSRIYDRGQYLFWTVPFRGWFLECRCALK